MLKSQNGIGNVPISEMATKWQRLRINRKKVATNDQRFHVERKSKIPLCKNVKCKKKLVIWSNVPFMVIKEK